MGQQIMAMRRRWPQFDLASKTDASAMWFGWLVGIERAYRVSLEFAMPSMSDNAPMATRFPVVRVLSPRLVVQTNAIEEAPLPHVYFDHPDITLSALCLFDPEKGEWSHNDLVAYTSVPWAADWLACYEGWLATGRWFGGGRHAAPKDENL
ncbi:hypothetical protein [Phyllobacterium ifriqiyense]|uniref:hypothetical protein n=1 Tax=Phyllobacterium ifriqiyense TaxID=314238 RepID=UPI00339AA7A3